MSYDLFKGLKKNFFFKTLEDSPLQFVLESLSGFAGYRTIFSLLEFSQASPRTKGGAGGGKARGGVAGV